MFCLNYCLASHTMVEIAGKLSEADPESPRFRTLKKAVCNPNNGQEVFLGGYNYRDSRNLIPRIIYFKTPHFSTQENNPLLPLRTAGLFNIEDKPLKITFSPATLGLSAGRYLLTDVWGNETIPFDGEYTVEVEAHGSRLFAVSCAEKAMLLDANMRINVCTADKLDFDYAGEAELFMTAAPEKAVFNGKELPFRTEAGSGNIKVIFRVPGKGTVTFK